VSLDRGGDNEQGGRCVSAAIVAKAPVRSASNDLMRTLAGAKSKCCNCVALQATQDICYTKLSSANRIQRSIYLNALGCQQMYFLSSIKLSRYELSSRRQVVHVAAQCLLAVRD
jgi:hypothetical protein